jgi:death-on-curing protein
MIRYLTKDEVLDIHRWSLQAFGGRQGLLDPGMLESALAIPEASFDGIELYPTLVEKAAALAYSLIQNHAFADGNKRVAFWAMATFLELNGFQVTCDQKEGADVFLQVAASQHSRDQLVEWLNDHCQEAP